MTAKVTRLPGLYCRFRLAGRCAYDEMLNPGLHDAWRCPEEQRLLRYYDGFVDRVDAFDLTPEEVADIWARRMRRFPPIGTLCTGYMPHDAPPALEDDDVDDTAEDDDIEDIMIDCVRFRDGICLLLLPACEGMCERYQKTDTASDDGA